MAEQPARTWEYKQILSVNPGGIDATWYEDGKARRGRPNILARVNELGREGWELIAVAPISWSQGGAPPSLAGHVMYWFKRPKTDALPKGFE
jgi:hypothetical protein